MDGIISKIKESGLLGRGGASFPTWQKWEAVKNEKADRKYIICNGSEGEPAVFKDKFILEKYLKDLIDGINIALETIDKSSAYIYLNKEYYSKFRGKLNRLLKGIKIVKKPSQYICGEETTLLNVIENNIIEPRIKPPLPCQSGLFCSPTLVNNIETFYYVSKIAKGEYKNTRFYSLSGDMRHKGVFELPVDFTIEQILKETNNSPEFDFFVQSGGGASGEILLLNELNQSVKGAGALIVFDRKKTNLLSLMERWAYFYINGNCDKCAPCREGIYRILEMIRDKKIDNEKMNDLFFVLEKTSLCPLGKSAFIPFKTLMDKVYADNH